MRLSDLHVPTLRDAPRDLDHEGQRALARAGFFRIVESVPGAGLALLPAGALAVDRLASHLSGAIARPLPQPIMLPAPPEASTDADLVVGLLARDLRSYRELPRVLATRTVRRSTVPRARAGLLGAREEPALELWLAAIDAELEETLAGVATDLRRALGGLGVSLARIDAPGPTGNAGERWVIPELTDDVTLSWCPSCESGADAELAPVALRGAHRADIPPHRAVETPEQRSVEDVAAFLGAAPGDLLKTMVVRADGALFAALVPGDRALSLVKLARLLGVDEVTLADDAAVVAATGAPVGFAGPVGLEIPIVADRAAASGTAWITGGNAADVHFVDVSPGRDFAVSRYGDLTSFEAGDPCPLCNAPRASRTGTELLAITRFGSTPAERIGLTVDASGGGAAPVAVGHITIRLGRTLGAIAERRVAAADFVWPAGCAPWDVAIVSLGKPGDATSEAAERVTASLRNRGLRTLFDDRALRPGQKLGDAELLGHPLVIVVGRRGVDNGVVELRRRALGDVVEVVFADVVDAVFAARAEEAGQ